MMFLDELEPGAEAVISSFDTDKLPLKLIEMGCLPGNKIALVHRALLMTPSTLRSTNRIWPSAKKLPPKSKLIYFKPPWDAHLMLH